MRWLFLVLLVAPVQAWETLPMPLPEPVADAAVGYDGHAIYVMGGTTDGPTDQVLRLDLDGTITRHGVLPDNLTGARAVFNGRGFDLFGGTNGTHAAPVIFYDGLEGQAYPTPARIPDNRTHVAPVWMGNHSTLWGGDPCNPCTGLRHVAPWFVEPMNVSLPWPIAEAGAFWDGHQVTILGGIRLDEERGHDRMARYDPVHQTMERLDVRLPAPGPAHAIYDGLHAYIFIEGHDHIVRYNPANMRIEELQPPIPRTEGASMVLAEGSIWIIHGDRILRMATSEFYVDHDNPWCARLDVAPCPPIRSSVPLLEILIGAALPILLAAMWWKKSALRVQPKGRWVVLASAALCLSALGLPWARASLGDATTQAGLLYVAGGWWPVWMPYVGAAALLGTLWFHRPLLEGDVRQKAAIAVAVIGVAWGIAAFAVAWSLQGTSWTWTWGALAPLLGVFVLMTGLPALER